LGTRQPARLPTAYGLPDVAVADEHTAVRSGLLPLLILFIGLAVATVWYVAPLAFAKPAVQRSCEVVVLKSGAPACVRDPTRRTQAAHASTGRTKR
jgi:hypothetical protein